MKLLLVLAAAAAVTGPVLAADPDPATVPAAVAPAPNAEAAPAELVKALYEGYFAALTAPDGGWPDVRWVDYSAPYLAPDLAARIAKTQTPESDPLDVDFLIVAQDYQDLKLGTIETTASDAASATVRVNFTNMGSPTVSDVKLAKLAEGWRIADIVANAGTPEQFSLTDVLKDMGV